jgi:hypothetical protein
MHYLSSDLKRTLTAAMDDTSTQSDLAEYIRIARLQVRTGRDAGVLKKFQQSFQLAKDSSEIQSRHFSEALKSIGSISSRDSNVDKLIDIQSEYLKSRIPVPKSLTDQIEQAIKDEKEQRKRDEEINDMEDKRAEDERKQARALYIEVRGILGLPPLQNVDTKQDKK